MIFGRRGTPGPDARRVGNHRRRAALVMVKAPMQAWAVDAIRSRRIWSIGRLSPARLAALASVSIRPQAAATRSTGALYLDTFADPSGLR